MKYEWRKQEKNLYGVKNIPSLINVPKQKYIMIQGKGNPNETEFSDKVSALYSLAYAIKTEYKSAATKDNFSGEIHDFTVYPLEGVWQLKEYTTFLKENLEYTIMIRQPDFINKDMVYMALEKVKVKKPTPLYDEIHFDSLEDGMCIEILHTGSYDDEPASFEKMNQFTEKNGLRRTKTCHREIYLNNAQKVDKSKLKTILRYPVQ